MPRESERKRDPGRTGKARLDVDERRSQLIGLGLDAFGSRPYDEVSIDDIAAAASISKGLLYHYFPTKKAFYVAVMQVAAKGLLSRVAAVAGASGSGSSLAAGVDAYLAYVGAHGRAYVALLRGAGVDPDVTAIVDGSRAAFLRRLLEGVAAALAPDRSTDAAIAARLAEDARLRLALRGWMGMVEAVAVEWIETASGRALDVVSIRDLLVGSLLAIVRVAQAGTVAVVPP